MSRPKTKKLFSIFMVLAMMMTMLPAMTTTASASDYDGHWAKTSIDRAVGMGWFAKSDTDSYRPNDSITRAEFVTMVNRVYGYDDQGDLSGFNDVKPSDWYYSAFAAAVAKGYIQGDEYGSLSPQANITRNEAVTIFVRISGLSSGDSSAVLANVSDSGSIPEWAKPYAGSAISAGLVAGSNGNFNGSSNINRAETAVLLERLYDDVRVYGFSGEYRSGNVGSIIIATAGVNLKNANVKRDVTIASTVGEGDVTLDGVTIAGKLQVEGGGSRSIHLVNCTIANLEVTKNGVRIVLENGGTVTYASVSGENVSIVLGENVNIGELTIEEGANAIIDIAETATIGEATFNGETTVTGAGEIAVANVNVDGVTIETAPDKVNVAENITTTIEGDKVTGESKPGDTGTTPPSSGGGSGGSSGSDSGSTSVSVSGVSITDAMTINVTLTASATGVIYESFTVLVDGTAITGTEVSTPSAGQFTVSGSGSAYVIKLGTGLTDGQTVSVAGKAPLGTTAKTATNLVPASVVISGGVTEYILPESGSNTVTPSFSAMVKNSTDVDIPNATIVWSVEGTPAGISITNGTLTIDTATVTAPVTAGTTITVRATCGSVYGTKMLIIYPTGTTLAGDLVAQISMAPGAVIGETKITITGLSAGRAIKYNPIVNANGAKPIAGSTYNSASYSDALTTATDYELVVGTYDLVEIDTADGNKVNGFGRLTITSADIRQPSTTNATFIAGEVVGSIKLSAFTPATSGNTLVYEIVATAPTTAPMSIPVSVTDIDVDDVLDVEVGKAIVIYEMTSTGAYVGYVTVPFTSINVKQPGTTNVTFVAGEVVGAIKLSVFTPATTGNTLVYEIVTTAPTTAPMSIPVSVTIINVDDVLDVEVGKAIVVYEKTSTGAYVGYVSVPLTSTNVKQPGTTNATFVVGEVVGATKLSAFTPATTGNTLVYEIVAIAPTTAPMSIPSAVSEISVDDVLMSTDGVVVGKVIVVYEKTSTGAYVGYVSVPLTIDNVAQE